MKVVSRLGLNNTLQADFMDRRLFPGDSNDADWYIAALSDGSYNRGQLFL